MSALDLTVKARRSEFEVSMPNTQILNMPMKASLEFLSIIGTDCVDKERKSADDVVDKINRILLRMARIDFERADAGGVIHHRVSEASDKLAIRRRLNTSFY